MVDFIIKIIIPLLCTVLTVYVVPLLKEKRIYNAVVIAVNAAEQIFRESGKGQEKYVYVKEWIQKKFKINDEDLEKIIESAVREINKAKGVVNNADSK